MHLPLVVWPHSTCLVSAAVPVSLAVAPHLGATQQGKTLVMWLVNSKKFPLRWVRRHYENTAPNHSALKQYPRTWPLFSQAYINARCMVDFFLS